MIAQDKSDDEDFHVNDAELQELQLADVMGSNRMSQRLHNRNFTLGKQQLNNPNHKNAF